MAKTKDIVLDKEDILQAIARYCEEERLVPKGSKMDITVKVRWNQAYAIVEF